MVRVAGGYAAMMPNWGNGQSYPLTVWGEVIGGNGSALVYLVDTPEMFGGEARIFASVDIRKEDIVRWSISAEVVGADISQRARKTADWCPHLIADGGLSHAAAFFST